MSNALFFLKNRADEATATASSEANSALGAVNVQDEQRTKVWRSGTGEESYLNFTMPANFSITHAIIVDCNLHPSATIRVQSWGGGLDKHIIKSQDNVTFDYTRASATGTFVDKTGKIVQSIADAPRFDHDPVTLTLIGLLCEPTRTNRCLHNQDKSNAAWVKTNVSVTTDTDWDGTTKNIKLTADAANATILQAITSASVERVYSVALKRVTGSGTIEITVDGGLSWQDVTSSLNSSTFTVVSKTQTVTNPNVGIRIATSGDVILATMDQEETGARYTSRILTGASTVTRNGDDPSQLLSAVSGFSATQGTIVVRAKQRTGNATEREYLLTLDDDTANERIAIFRFEGTSDVQFQVRDGAVNQVSTNITVTDFGLSNRFGVSWAANDFAMCVNGGTVSTDVAGTLPTITKVHLGGRISPATEQFNGWIQEVQMYAVAVSDADLQTVTTGAAIATMPIMDLDLTVAPGVDETVNPTVFVEEDQSSFYGLGGYGVGGFGGTPSNVNPQGKNITLIPFDASTHRYWRITFTDDATTYQQVGRVFLGTALEFAVNLSYGWSTRQEERSQSRESIGGQRYSQPREDRRVIRGGFDWMTDDERTTFLRSYQRIGDTTPIIFSLLPEATFAGLTTTVYGRLNAPEVTGTFFNVNSMTFEVIEEL